MPVIYGMLGMAWGDGNNQVLSECVSCPVLTQPVRPQIRGSGVRTLKFFGFEGPVGLFSRSVWVISSVSIETSSIIQGVHALA